MNKNINLTYIPTLKLMPVLPAVYGDELSYYETLAHLQSALNTNTEQLANAFEQVYQMLVDGIGSGVAISYTDGTEDIMFVVSSDIKPEEPVTNEDLIMAVQKNAMDITVLNTNLGSESATRATADTALGKRIDTEITNRTDADNALDNRIDEVAPVVYTDETDDIEFGDKDAQEDATCSSLANRVTKLEDAVKDNEPTPIGEAIRLSGVKENG